MAGYKDWIEAININIDYFSAFMKAWVAFNAWYKFSGEIPPGTDQKCIEYISEQSNRFKTYMTNLLNATDSEGLTYQDNLVKLHEALLNAAITTQEFIGVRQQISFSEVAVKNKNNLEKFDYSNIHYKCLRSQGKLTTTVKNNRTGLEILHIEQDEYDEETLKQQSIFIQLSDTQKTKCLQCYKKLNPYIITSVLDTSEEARKIGVYSFINDSNKRSQAIITILYMLRCCLAHGDISPDEAAHRVYKYAYEVIDHL